MKNVKLDPNGIPILSRTDIEIRTEGFIRALAPSCLDEPRATPIASIALRLKEGYGATFLFGQDLGTTSGRKIRGCFHIPSKTIFIDKSLEEGGPRFNFTLAHEIGHFVMHQDVTPTVLAPNKRDKIEDNDRDLILDHSQTDNPRSWIEWQANKFASSLLLPRSTLPSALLTKQKELGINRNLGKLYLNRQQSSSFRDYRAVMDYLIFIYRVSASAIRIRLRELNILEDTSLDAEFSPRQRSSQPESIQDILKRLFDK